VLVQGFWEKRHERGRSADWVVREEKSVREGEECERGR